MSEGEIAKILAGQNVILDKLKDMNGHGMAIVGVQKDIESLRRELQDQKSDAKEVNDRLSKNIGELFALQRESETKINNVNIKETATSTKVMMAGVVITALIALAKSFI